MIASCSFTFPFPVTGQAYEAHILIQDVTLGNDALFKCTIPSRVSDFVSVESWVDSEGQQFGSAGSHNGNLAAKYVSLCIYKMVLIERCILLIVIL